MPAWTLCGALWMSMGIMTEQAPMSWWFQNRCVRRKAVDFVPQAGEIGSCSLFSDFVGAGSCGYPAWAVGVLWSGK